MDSIYSLSLGTVLKFAVGLNYDNYWYFDRRLVLVVSSILLIFPLCFSKTIKFLQIPRYADRFVLPLEQSIANVDPVCSVS